MTRTKIATYGEWLDQIKFIASRFPEAGPYHADIYNRSCKAFLKEHGRDPRAEDTIEAVPKTADEVTATYVAAIAKRMEAEGIPHAYAHAFRRTQLMALNDDMRDKLRPEVLAVWDAAVDEYGTFKRMSEEAERAGEHPALVLALLRSGMRFPRGAQLLVDGPVVRFALDTPFRSLNAAWAEAMQEYQRDNPDDETFYDILMRAGSD